MRQSVLFVALLATICLCACNSANQTEESYADKPKPSFVSETMPLVSWYSPEEDDFHSIDTIDGNAKITLTIPADHPTFFSTKDHVMNIWSRYEEEDSLELSNFVAVRYDDADIWFVNQDNWTNLSRGDSAISGDFIITLYYGNDTVKVHGREISI